MKCRNSDLLAPNIHKSEALMSNSVLLLVFSSNFIGSYFVDLEAVDDPVNIEAAVESK